MSTAIKVENLSKAYQLGEIGTGTISRDIERWFARIRGKEDPFLKLGEVNDRTVVSKSNIVWSLKDINFEIQQGDAVGIIGRNGAGKSTLLKLLSRVTSPTTGIIKAKGRIASLLEVGTGFHPELTGKENIYLNGAILGMRKKEIDLKFDEIVDFSGVEKYIDTPVKRYSSGMYVRLAFAVAAYLESEILIVDEVLAVGDAEFQKKCLGKMKDVSSNEGRTVLFVSHNMDAVKTLCNKGLLLHNGQNQKIGDAADIIANYRGESVISYSKDFELNKSKPCITRIVLDQKALQTHTLLVDIDYHSPWALSPPIAGMVIYNALNVPVMGSNPRYHKEGFQGIPLSKGTIQVSSDNLDLHSGVYKISVWLGDGYKDYDAKEEAITFEYQGKESYSYIPDPLIIGSIDKKFNWRLI